MNLQVDMVNRNRSENKTEIVSFKLTPKLHDRLKELAQAKGDTKSQVLCDLISDATAYDQGDNEPGPPGSKVGSLVGH